MELYGIIIASLVSAIVEVVLLYFTIRGRFQFRFNFFKIVLVPVVFFVMVLVLEPLFGNKMPFLIHSVYVFVCLFLLWWVYRRELKFIIPLNNQR